MAKEKWIQNAINPSLRKKAVLAETLKDFRKK